MPSHAWLPELRSSIHIASSSPGRITIGGSAATAGRLANATKTMATSRTTNIAPLVGKVPIDAATGFLVASEPAIASAGTMIEPPPTLPLPALKSVLEENLLAVTAATERVTRHEELIAAQVPQWRLYPAVQALMCLRGFQLTAATVLVAELGDIRRFNHPRHVRAFLGLVPHARHVRIADATHMVAGDRNDAFNAGVAEFLARAQAPPAGTGASDFHVMPRPFRKPFCVSFTPSSRM